MTTCITRGVLAAVLAAALASGLGGCAAGSHAASQAYELTVRLERIARGNDSSWYSGASIEREASEHPSEQLGLLLVEVMVENSAERPCVIDLNFLSCAMYDFFLIDRDSGRRYWISESIIDDMRPLSGTLELGPAESVKTTIPVAGVLCELRANETILDGDWPRLPPSLESAGCGSLRVGVPDLAREETWRFSGYGPVVVVQAPSK
ncbi:MAG: hypothetical protein U0638_12840 [Phycisphaerales bacterium]